MPKKVAKLGLTKLSFAYCKNANSCKVFKGENQAEFNFLPYFCLQLLTSLEIAKARPFLDSFTNKNCTIVLAYFLVVTFLKI